MAGVFESEVGPLLEMKTDVPMALRPDSETKDKNAAPHGSKGFWKWILWLVLAGMAIFGGWRIWKLRKKSAEENSPDAESAAQE